MKLGRHMLRPDWEVYWRTMTTTPWGAPIPALPSAQVGTLQLGPNLQIGVRRLALADVHRHHPVLGAFPSHPQLPLARRELETLHSESVELAYPKAHLG